MIHLSIAKNIITMGFQCVNLSQFYLGAISPDATHIKTKNNKNEKKNTFDTGRKKTKRF